MDYNLFLPVFVSFVFSFLNFLFYNLTRKIRKWLTCFGGIAVFLSSIYITLKNFGFYPVIENISFFFSILISTIGLFSIFYSQWYCPEKNFVYDCLVFLFIGALNGVVLSSSLILFYIFWEVMTFTGFFLTIFDYSKEAKDAGIKFIVMNFFGSILLLFSILGINLIEENLLWKHLIFLFIFLASGIKAGLFPLHAWLPDTYSVSPTPVSAIFSGVMSKLGIFAFIKFYYLIFTPSWSTGWEDFFIIIGMLTLMIGVMLALIQHDIKRLLAFHSISQIGYIFLGISCGTGIGLCAGLYHLLNHALFKSLLFLGAGVLIKMTGSRELEKYGGFSSVIPFTFSTFLIASLSISGIPPFNGFVSKWIICQALLQKGRFITIFAMIVSLFGSALTLASFAKVLNDAFLGVRKGEIKEKISEKSFNLIFPMGMLAFGCLFFGMLPEFSINKIFKPICGEFYVNVELIKIVNFWGYLSILLIFIFSLFASKLVKSLKEKKIFIGGETISREKTSFDGSHFYKTISEMEGIEEFYKIEEKGGFDFYLISEKIFNFSGKFLNILEVFIRDKIYIRGANFINFLTEKIKSFHNGLIPRYIFWVIVGIIFIMEVIKR